MIRTTLLAATTLLFATPALAQPQAALDARYDRALAAGYKALFLCSAISNAESNGAMRTPESVMEWELTGIQQPLNDMVADLPYFIERGADGAVDYVLVEWGEDQVQPRIAARQAEGGCSLLPIGADVPFEPDTVAAPPTARGAAPEVRQLVTDWYPIRAAFGDTYGADSRTTAILLAGSRPGSRIWEFYGGGFDAHTPQRTWSVAKSIAATLVGAAVQRGEADPYASAGLGEDANDPRRAITIDHALRMASGRYSDTPGNRTDPLYFGGATVDEVAVDWPLIARPGSMFRYANNDTLAAVQAIEETFDEHPPAALFAALDMEHTVAETDWQGNYILSSQVWSTARDLARLGQLYLNDGVLRDGTRILPTGWVEYVSTPSGPQPGGSQWGYGAGWWTMGNFEGIPADAFAARGNRGQYIVIIPSADLVIVRRGEDPAGGSGFDIVQFTRDVLAVHGG